MKRLLAFWCFALLCGSRLSAQSTPDPSSDRQTKVDEFLSTLHFQQGNIPLGDGLATLRVPSAFQYLNAADTDKVLTKLWGNPPGDKHLGMLLPADVSVASADSWGVIISYVNDGFVKDDDASKINYDELMKDMQKSTREASAQRVKDGYSGIELVGWAAPPRYDAAAKKLYWAKELRFSDSNSTTLNYDIRVLGRRGVLSLNCVAAMDQLPSIQERAPEILRMVEFNQGNRYADFAPSTDKVAAYGVGALIAGGILAKAGFFKVLLVALLAAKKFVIIGAIAVVSFFKRIFGKKDSAPPA